MKNIIIRLKMKLEDGINYRFLDLPVLPPELEQECLDQLNRKEFFLFDLGRLNGGNWTFERQMMYKGEMVFKKQCIFEVFDAPEIVKEWLLDNKIINDLSARVGVQRSYGGNTLLPHVDKGNSYGDLRHESNLKQEKKYYTDSRSTAWNYLLTEPGPTTCFYESQDINSIIESIVIPKSAWHELNVSVLHGVENIELDRISLSVSLNK
jgi:hypothetical protein